MGVSWWGLFGWGGEGKLIEEKKRIDLLKRNKIRRTRSEKLVKESKREPLFTLPENGQIREL